MKLVKIRRVGNSNVVSLPREFEEAGYVEGTTVAIERAPGGELVIVPESQLRENVGSIARRAIEANRGALDILAAYDRGEVVDLPDNLRRE